MVPFAGSATANCTGTLMGVTSPRGDAHTYMAPAVRSPLGFRWALSGWRPVLALARLARVAPAVGRDLCVRACAFQSRPHGTGAGSPRWCVQARESRHSRKATAQVPSHRNRPIGGAAVCRRASCTPAVLPAGRPVRATNNVNHSWNPLNR